MDNSRVDWMGNDRIRIRRARIVEIEFERRRAFVTVVYKDDNRGNQRLVLLISKDTEILDEEKNAIRARELRKGMIINAVVSSQFTRSNPPQTQAFRIVVKKDAEQIYTSEGYVLYASRRRNELVLVEFKEDDSYDLSAFTITGQTMIVNSMGQPIALEDLRRGSQVIVEHSAFETKRFPPTAIAYKIEQS